MITLKDYWMGRDVKHGQALGPDTRRNAARTVELIDALLNRARAAGVECQISPVTGSVLTSGWRPPAINAATPGAAPNSKHITGQAADVYDPQGDLDEWLSGPTGMAALDDIGLWLEHPASTKGWSHLQTVPPNSGRRVFYP